MTGKVLNVLAATSLMFMAGMGTTYAGDWAEHWENIDIEQYGSVQLNYDYFPKDAQYADQDDVMGNIDLRPQLVVMSDNAELVIEPRVVIPHRGSAYVDLKEAFINTSVADLDVLVGNTTVFWGKAEAINLVDIINTKDYTRGMQSGEKQGMPMVRVMTALGPGDAEFYVLPHFVENRYADERSRHRTSLPIKENTSEFFAGDDKNDPGYAFRYSGYAGDLDYGVSYFSGISRSPGFQVDPMTMTLVPLYHEITQTGVDVQWIYGDTSFKAEAIRRTKQLNSDNVAEDYNAGIVGVEHNYFGIWESNADLAVFTEYARDTRGERAGSGMQDDVFLGAILTMNDVDDTQLRVISSYDLDYSSKSVTAEFERRVLDNINMEASIYAPAGMDDDEQFSSFKNDTRVHLGLKYSW